MAKPLFRVWPLLIITEFIPGIDVLNVQNVARPLLRILVLMATHSSTFAWKIPWAEEPGRPQSMGLQRVGVAKSWTQLSDFTFTFHFYALEKAMAPHSSTLAWKIPWAEEPGRPQSMGSQRVGHD